LAPGRGHEARRSILPDDYQGTVVTDRWHVYGRFWKRGLCHAHLKRNWKALSERKHPDAKRLGDRGVEETQRLLVLKRQFRAGEMTEAQFRLKMKMVKARYARLLNAAEDCADPKTRTMAQQLNEVWGFLWTFATVSGVEPTNNEAERAIRPAVLWRKGSLGTWSDAGQRFVERMLTVAATARKTGIPLLELLLSVCEASLRHLPAPRLYPVAANPSPTWSVTFAPTMAPSTT
jgi:transposase